MIDADLQLTPRDAGKKFKVELGSAWRYALAFNADCLAEALSGGVALYATAGEPARSVAFTAPVRIDWRLYAASNGVVDDLPVWQGSTFFATTPTPGARKGLLVQVSGRVAPAWVLEARVVDAAGAHVTLGVMLTVHPLDPRCAGPELPQVGPMVG